MLLWPYLNVIKRKNCALVSVVRSTNEWKSVVFPQKLIFGWTVTLKQGDESFKCTCGLNDLIDLQGLSFWISINTWLNSASWRHTFRAAPLYKRGNKVTQCQLKLHPLLHQALKSRDLSNNLITTNKNNTKRGMTNFRKKTPPFLILKQQWP